MKNNILSMSLCLTLFACGSGQIHDPVLDDAALAEQRQGLVDRLAHPVDPQVPTTGPGFPHTPPRVDPTMDPTEFGSEPKDKAPIPKPHVVDPTEPEPELGGPSLPTSGDDGVSDPTEPQPEPETPALPDLGTDPYTEKTCHVETRCRRVAAGQECVEQPQQCPPMSTLCSTVTRHCTTLYVEACSDIEVCDQTG